MNKKNILTIIAILIYGISNALNAQWVYQDVNSEQFGVVKMAVNKANSNCDYLSMGVNDILRINSQYFCDTSTIVDIVLILSDSSSVKYHFIGIRTIDKRSYEFDMNIWNDVFISNFKKSIRCIINVNQMHCNNHIYDFNMQNSNDVYEFLTK